MQSWTRSYRRSRVMFSSETPSISSFVIRTQDQLGWSLKKHTSQWMHRRTASLLHLGDDAGGTTGGSHNV